MRRAWPHVGAAVWLTVLSAVQPALAHEVRSALLELREAGAETYDVQWRVPARGDLRLRLDPRFPEGCDATVQTRRSLVSSMYVDRWTVRCPGGLNGRRIHVEGLSQTMTDVVARIVRADGRVQTARVIPSDPYLTVEAAPGPLAVAATYLSLGLKHILLGADHLLFVLGLMLIVHNRWMLLKTITSFTVAHSVTLAIATLGYASAPPDPLNAAIALSILFLGPEIVRCWRGGTSLTIRHPWIVAFAFGLLHGFGFASGLTTMGLPSSEIPVALLLFNVGVEAGQIFFVGLVLLLERSFRVLEVRWPRWVEALPAYAVGSLGAYWTIQRTVILIGSLR